jgi:predicted DNA-binding transcriptional regulator YafY
LEGWRFGDDDPVVAELLVDAGRAAWVRRQLGEEAVAEERADGSLVFRIPVLNRAAFRSFALDLLDSAEVLGPPELRRGIVAWLEDVAGRPVPR